MHVLITMQVCNGSDIYIASCINIAGYLAKGHLHLSRENEPASDSK